MAHKAAYVECFNKVKLFTHLQQPAVSDKHSYW